MWCDTKYSQLNSSWAQLLTALGLENIFHETCVGGDFFKECQSIISVMGKIMADLKTLFLFRWYVKDEIRNFSKC